MADPTRRHSRFPAVNRDVAPQAPQSPVEAPETLVEAPHVETAPEAPEAPSEAPEASEQEAAEEEEGAPEEEVVENLVDLSGMSTKEVLAWVGDDEDLRVLAIESERSGAARKGLLKKLGA